MSALLPKTCRYKESKIPTSPLACASQRPIGKILFLQIRYNNLKKGPHVRHTGRSLSPRVIPRMAIYRQVCNMADITLPADIPGGIIAFQIGSVYGVCGFGV